MKTSEKIVFTNGCFDILHVGHVTYLKAARAMGDRLILGLNSDGSVRRLKGENRPINTADDRKTVLLALEFVDEVIVFDEDTPLRLIQEVNPDILVKGGDYEVRDIVGYDHVTSNGGKVLTIPLVEGVSTTKIIRELKENK